MKSTYTLLRLPGIMAALVFASNAWGQVIVHPNQINGTISFSNTSPAMLDLLDDSPGKALGAEYFSITARSTQTPFRANTRFDAGSRLGGSYEISVESGPPGAGIVYALSVFTEMADSPNNNYRFLPIDADPIEEEPAPDVVLDISECAGALRVTFVDSVTSAPVQVDGSQMTAHYEETPGSGNFWESQARRWVTTAAGETVIVVRGDGTLYRFELTFTTGTDPYWDELRWEFTHDATVGCEEIVDVTVPVIAVEIDPTNPHDHDHQHDPNDPNDPWHGDRRLGRILGEMDMLGEDEHIFDTARYSKVTAKDGPFSNLRLDWLNWSPSSGYFELPNVMPSDFATPAVDYSLRGEMVFRKGRRLNSFKTPTFGDDIKASVVAGQTTNVGDLLVIDPGWLVGDILLAGPPVSPSPLESVVRSSDIDVDGDGLPDNWIGKLYDSRIGASWHNDDGGFITYNGGASTAIFEGEYQIMNHSFEGDYELVLGGLNRGDSLWKHHYIYVTLDEKTTPSVPESYLDTNVVISSGGFNDPKPTDIAMTPGHTEVQDRHYCFGQLFLRYTSVGGVFSSPSVSFRGTLAGLDFELNEVDQILSGNAKGTPRIVPADVGLVVAMLPHGSHDLTPSVRIHDPLGGTSTVRLTDIPFEMGCKHVYDVWLDFYFNLAQPACTAEPISTIDGDVVSTEPVASIEYTLNGGTPVNVCTSCGIAPSFSFDLTLDPGPNTIIVTAIEEVTLRRAVTTITQTLDSAPLPDYGNVLKAVEEGDDVHFYWQTPPGATITQLARADEKTFATPAGIATVDALTFDFIDVGVKPPAAGTELYYQVRGLDCGGTPGP